MITKERDVPLLFEPASSAPCHRCDDVTANLCGRCGALKSPSLSHVGQLPDVETDRIVSGQVPSAKAFYLATIMSAIGGFIAGLGAQEFFS